MANNPVMIGPGYQSPQTPAVVPEPSASGGGAVDDTTATLLLRPQGSENAIVVKAPSEFWDADVSGYGTAQAFVLLREDYTGGADPEPARNVLMRINGWDGGIGTAGGIHVAPDSNDRQHTGYAPTEAIWVDPNIDVVGVAIDAANDAPVSNFIQCRRNNGTMIASIGPTGIITASDQEGTAGEVSIGAQFGIPAIVLGTDALLYRQAANVLATGNGDKLLVDAEIEINGALNHDGTQVGFYGTAPIAKPTGVAVTAGGIHAALVSLGLIAA